MNASIESRAFGCLAGAAAGDAIGAPASFLTRAEIKRTYGCIGGFLDAADITDDTQETMIIAELLIRDGEFCEDAFCLAMKNWALEKKMLESDLIGPSTRRFLASLIEGKDPREGAKTSDTNGSAMRVAPVGIKYWRDMDLCVKAAARSSLPSHGSAPAVAAACAVAA
ncbi:MAG: ADP-ribosylglycohydrolase family protein, partial [Clostridiales bacterium]|nr:ADP-ribosylglycohydrolase family protein [Clostridiales bacterium]